MKNYEQKYKEALEKVRIWQDHLNESGDKDYADELNYIFPELKESEDEKIRKELLAVVNDLVLPHEQQSRFIAWLEKQGENHKAKTALEAANEEKVDNQNCVKPADKVEPKFKVGDWIKHNKTHFVFKILKITPFNYEVVNQLGYHHTITNAAIENNYHLWTIKDAKDGDVLCCESGWTCIFKALGNHTNTFSSYCFMDKTKWFCETGSECHTLDKRFVKAYNGEISPATKEQRDLLFQKMKEAVYTFDFEKKELKKIEQKSVWSEEDERLCSCIIEEQEKSLDNVKNSKYGHSEIISDLKEMYRERIDWLKSLKQRIGE